MKWIKVEDDLPEFKKNVICYLGQGEPTIMKLERVAQYSKDGPSQNEWTGSIGNASFVTHWAHLPELPNF